MVNKLVQKIKSSRLVWKYSGLTYRWSVLATRGKYLTLNEYLQNSVEKIKSLSIDIQQKKVLEFGTGIGGNLLCIAKEINKGVGVDVNCLYTKRANRLKNFTIPIKDKFDVVFSLNVFERIPHDIARKLVIQLFRLVSQEGILVLFFLGERARSTGFVNRLGEDAYSFWSLDELKRITPKFPPGKPT